MIQSLHQVALSFSLNDQIPFTKYHCRTHCPQTYARSPWVIDIVRNPDVPPNAGRKIADWLICGF